MRLKSAQAETVGGAMRGLIDERHRGLFCRADPACDQVFPVAHDALPTAAAVLRDTHELAHGYVHVVPVFRPRHFNAGAVVQRGRAIT